MNKNIVLVPALVGTMLLGGAVAGYAGLAAAQSSDTQSGMGGFMEKRGPHVGGEITAISGTTITIAGRGTTYSVDASAATFMKDGAVAELSSFAVGDHAHVLGTIDGTNVKAEKVMGGMKGGKGGPGRHGKGHGVMGTVSAVNGSTITVSGMDGTSYTVDASSALVKRMVDGALSDVTIGDKIGVHGIVSGTNVTAKQIMDDVPEKPFQ